MERVAIGAGTDLEVVLRPQVTQAFEGENVSMLPRPELALRIGQVVSQHLESSGKASRFLVPLLKLTNAALALNGSENWPPTTPAM